MPVNATSKRGDSRPGHRGQLIGDGEGVEHRRQPGIEYAVQCEHVDPHG
jgi:hypothetical protein